MNAPPSSAWRRGTSPPSRRSTRAVTRAHCSAEPRALCPPHLTSHFFSPTHSGVQTRFDGGAGALRGWVAGLPQWARSPPTLAGCWSWPPRCTSRSHARRLLLIPGSSGRCRSRCRPGTATPRDVSPGSVRVGGREPLGQPPRRRRAPGPATQLAGPRRPARIVGHPGGSRRASVGPARRRPRSSPGRPPVREPAFPGAQHRCLHRLRAGRRISVRAGVPTSAPGLAPAGRSRPHRRRADGRRDIAAHRAWMIRGYEIALAAGTQALTEGAGGAVFGTGELRSDLAKGAGWSSTSPPPSGPFEQGAPRDEGPHHARSATTSPATTPGPHRPREDGHDHPARRVHSRRATQHLRAPACRAPRRPRARCVTPAATRRCTTPPRPRGKRGCAGPTC